MSIDLDRASKSIDDLIERRAQEAEAANREAQAWRESERRFVTQLEREHRELWAEHHRRQIAVFGRLAEEHRERLRLVDGAA